jgi:hypothetical protein
MLSSGLDEPFAVVAGGAATSKEPSHLNAWRLFVLLAHLPGEGGAFEQCAQ